MPNKKTVKKSGSQKLNKTQTTKTVKSGKAVKISASAKSGGRKNTSKKLKTKDAKKHQVSLKKTKIIKETGMHDKDTGSPEVQVALLSKKIEELTLHLKKHRKDNHSRRGLLGMVANRQTHLNYLKKNHPRRYSSIVKKLEFKK